MNKISSMVGAVLVVLMIAFAPVVSAYDVDTLASISQTGNPPVVEKIIVLDPNMDESGDLGHNLDGTQIMPEPGVGNTVTLTHFWKYAVVSDPNGRSDISVVNELFYDINDVQIGTERIATLMDTADAENVLQAALDAELIDNVAIIDANGNTEYSRLLWMLSDLKKLAYMYKIENTLTNHDEPGVYTVKFKATDSTGGVTITPGTFTYTELKALALDFDNINYGPINVNVQKWASGDDDFMYPGFSDTPTLKNQGNKEFQIKVNATDLAGDILDVIGNPTGVIQYIGAEYLSVEFMGEHIDSCNLGTNSLIDGPGLENEVTLNGLLQPCTPTQISFDIWAPLGTGNANYQGTATILIA